MYIIYIFNNIVIEKKDSIMLFSYKTYGLKKNFNKYILKRTELNNNFIISNYSNNEFNFFLTIVYNIVPENFNVFSKQTLNIWFLDCISCYRGWRHSLGLPVRGQRTWTNSNSVFKSNNILRDFKLNLAKKFYGNIPLRQINIGLIAEQINFLWKNQWGLEWQLSRNSILKQTSKFNFIKIDLFSMFNFQVMHPNKLKSLSKKQKQSFKKNHFSLGFEIGFSKPLLQAHNKIDVDDNNAYKNASIILKSEKPVKKNLVKKKITTSKKTVKKKKSVWDF